jgi:release factor glutamine methyltransferase
MTLQEVKAIFLKTLAQKYPKEEILSFFFMACKHQLGYSRADIALNPSKELQKIDIDFFSMVIADLQHEKPIQYILGETEFFGLPFNVNSNVLIPRPETEELVAWVLEVGREMTKVGRQKRDDGREMAEDRKQKFKSQPNSLKILDIGTGSGCIAIALAKRLPKAEVYALDVSKKALHVARHNAKHNDVKVHFIKQDILKATVVEEHLKFDIIASNPPYVRELEKHHIQKNVLENEPHLALFVKDDNPLLFYDAIADVATKKLRKGGGGYLFFEINQYLGKELVSLLQQKGFGNIELKKDMFGNDRMVRASFNNY